MEYLIIANEEAVFHQGSFNPEHDRNMLLNDTPGTTIEVLEKLSQDPGEGNLAFQCRVDTAIERYAAERGLMASPAYARNVYEQAGLR